MELDVLPNGEIGGSPPKAASEVGHGSQLLRGEQSVRNPDANHEQRQRPALSTLSADNARAIALGVDTPPSEICSQPFRWNRGKTLARKAPDFVEPLPRVQLVLQALNPLCRRFFYRVCHK